MACVKSSNSKENVTNVVKTNAAGRKIPPLFIFKQQWIRAAYVYTPRPRGSWDAATDSSFMQAPIYLRLKRFKEIIVDNGLHDDNRFPCPRRERVPRHYRRRDVREGKRRTRRTSRNPWTLVPSA